jgi:hypothetical protein
MDTATFVERYGGLQFTDVFDALQNVALVNEEGIDHDHAVTVCLVGTDRWVLTLQSVLDENPAMARNDQPPVFSVSTAQLPYPDDRYIAWFTNDWTRFALGTAEAEAIEDRRVWSTTHQ